MTVALQCLTGFALWAALLAVAVVSARTWEVLAGRKRVNEFTPGIEHGSARYWRLNRAQVNTVENLPIFGALVAVGALAHVASPAFATAPLVVLGARIVQSAAHVASGSSTAVMVRVTAFLTQVACFLWMALALLTTVG